MIEKGRNCTECGECLRRCPYQLPIPDLIKENLSLYDSFVSGVTTEKPMDEGRPLR